jgi:hypothetical protein
MLNNVTYMPLSTVEERTSTPIPSHTLNASSFKTTRLIRTDLEQLDLNPTMRVVSSI